MKMVSAAWTQPPHATDPNGSYLPATSFPFVTLEFAYDGLSRRVQKKTIKNGAVEMEGYVYDGWNVLMISNLDPLLPPPLPDPRLLLQCRSPTQFPFRNPYSACH